MESVGAICLRELSEAGLLVKCDEKHGRYLVAGRKFKKGEVVLSCGAYGFVGQWAMREAQCDNCLAKRNAEGVTLKRCAGCQSVWYCSEECQRMAWKKKFHRFECKRHRLDEGLFACLPNTTVDEVRLCCNLLWRRDAELVASTTKAGAKASNTMQFADFGALVDHYDEIEASTDAEVAQRCRGTHQLAQAILKRVQGTLSFEVSEELVCRTLYRMQCNDFGIWDGMIFMIGAGVYPTGALVNHSCDASCCVTYRFGHDAKALNIAGKPEADCYHSLGPVQQFRASRDLEVGDEITHCYMDLASTTEFRRKETHSQYFFACDCKHCVPPREELDKHLTGTLGGRKLTLEEEKKLFSAGQMTEDGNNRAHELEESLNLLDQAYRIRSSLLDPLNLERMTTTAHLMTAEIESNNWERAARLAEEILQVYRAVYPPIHPMLGLHLYTYGDLLFQIGDKEKAREAHTECLEILSTTHGEDSEVARGLRKLLANY